MKRIVIDLDETLSTKKENENYANAQPKNDVIAKLRYYKNQGYSICIFTARNMRTYDGNIGLINVHTLPIITKWLDEHSVPYDEIVVGKPWCGEQGFYVDDRAIRPNEFASLTESEIANLLNEQ
jgi:capsule biosynthesis phosphatase